MDAVPRLAGATRLAPTRGQQRDRRRRFGTSEPRALFLPFQLALVSPFLAPVWIVALIKLLRDPVLRWCRAIRCAYVLLAVVFVATGGKPYYLAAMFPVLLAAGAQPTADSLGVAHYRCGAHCSAQPSC